MKTICVFIIGTIFYVAYSLLLPAYGVYEGYNKIILGNPGALGVIYDGAKSYFTFLRPTPYIIFSGILTFVIFRKFKTLSAPSKNDVEQIFFLMLLFFAAILPYLLVGKSADISSWSDWSGRQAMLVVLPTALLLGLIFQLIFHSLKLNGFFGCLLASLVILTFFVTNGINLIRGVSEKLTRQIFEKKLEEVINQKVYPPPAGILQISVDGLPSPAFRPYESNYLLYRIYGRSDWWVNVSEKYQDNFVVPEYIKYRKEYQEKYIHNYIPRPTLCNTNIKLKATGYLGFENQIKLILNMTNIRETISLVEVITDCKKSLP